MSFLKVSRLGRIALVVAAAGCMDATKSLSPNGSDESSRLTLADGSFNPALHVDTPFPASSIVGGAAAFTTAGTSDVIANGAFSSSLTGWTTWNTTGSGTWRTYTGTTSPQSGYTIPAPLSGAAAIVDMSGAGTYIMYQDVVVPQGAQLSFDYFLANRYSFYQNGTLTASTQQFRVDVISPTATITDLGTAVLRNVYATQPGVTPLTTPWQHVTADLSAFAGQTVRLRFAAGVWLLWFQVGIDNVSLVGNVNAAPTVSFASSYSTNEGQAVTVSATAADADNDPLTYKWDINNDGVIDSTTTTNSLSLTYGDNGSFPVKVTVDDAHGHTASATTTIAVANVAPAFSSISPATSIAVGGTFNLSALFNDAGSNDGPFALTIDWGDNTAANGNVASVGTPITAAHVYANYGVYTVKLTVKDKDGATSEPATVIVTTTDNTPAVITPTVTGTKVGDWYTSDVNVSFNIVDPETGVASKDGCDAVTISTDTPAGGKVITCTAKNGAGQTSTGTVTIQRDASVPTVTPTPNGPFNAVTGWYTGDVSVSWAAVANGPSGATASCPVVTISNDTAGQELTCTATTGAGKTTTGHITIKRDATIPTVTAAASGAQFNGWYTSDATVHFTVSAAGISGLTANCPDVTLSSDTPSQTFTCIATTGAGISGRASITLQRDATKPDVSLLGNAGTYTVDQAVNITCVFNDAMSGVATKTCTGAVGSAFSFGLGAHTVSATATDAAGNSRSVSGSFTVVATTASITTLVGQWVTSADVIAGLSDKLAAVQASLNRGNTKAAGNQLDAFINQVNAQTGKSIAADKAALLIAFANSLR